MSVSSQERKADGDGTTVMLWICILLFFARVVGQIEVLLLAPPWLPEMSAWYSGLLPYPLLLPLQIALLMLMCVLVVRAPERDSETPALQARTVSVWRALALIYFAVMAIRLVYCIYRYGGDYYLHGAIPIAFHWVLALFALLCARRYGSHSARPAAFLRPPAESEGGPKQSASLGVPG